MNAQARTPVLECAVTAMTASLGVQPLAAEIPDRALDGERRFAGRFTEFVERNARLAYRVAYAQLRGRADAEDCVQELFLKLYRTNRWEGAADERAYVARAAWRMAGEMRARRPVHDDVAEREFAGSAPSPERAAMDGEAHARVHRLIDALPPKLRAPLVLCSIEGLSSAEAAFALGVPEGTVRRRMKEARELLRAKLRATEEVRRGR